ncbi:alpha/beta fold hydrolase [Erythrobacter sp. HA6-11]
MTIEKGYSAFEGGQIHWRMWSPDTPSAPDLYCLHPAPFSGLAFANIAPLFAQKRRVIAPDYPGYGGSDPLAVEWPTIADYAVSLAYLAKELAGDAPKDLLGFHSGCFVAVEMAIQQVVPVRKACLIDVPAMETETAAKLATDHQEDVVFSEDIESLEPVWNSTFVKRLASQCADQSLAMFAERLRAGRRANAAFAAAFSYPWEARFAELRTPSRVIATQSMLLDATRRAAATLPEAQMVERLDITRSVLDEGAAETASEVLAFLDQD